MALSRRELLAGAGASIALARCRTAAVESTSASSQSTPALHIREVERVVDALPSVDGAGVKLHRALGQRALGMLDPFLLLDEIHSDDPDDYAAGFPEHPHRGFETVTYMIDGAMEHRDSVGNHGHLGPGSAQWMTAGHGIVHSEMPRQERGRMWGFQLWVNLPAAKKMIPPRYQDIAPERIAEVARDRARVRVVAGRAFGSVGPVTGIEVDPLFLDLDLEKGAALEHAVEEAHAAFVYVPAGAVRIGQAKTEVHAGQLAVLGRGDSVTVGCDAVEGRVLLFAGRPIGEPVARSGPFVMNTNDELRKAWEDYRAGRLTEG
jgi:redox-sensitive bicupin YhaK (pirin superfamily)